MNLKKIIPSILIAAVTALITVFVYSKLFPGRTEVTTIESVNSTPSRLANYAGASAGINFMTAAELTTPAVVHVRNTSSVQVRSRHPFADIFGEDWYSGDTRQQKQVSSGSGVIISSDGLIVTNNHVIDRAKEIEITLNDKRSYKATLIGTDPSTDLALLQVEEDGLPFIQLGNSDEVGIGQWVMAVGNPFDLTSTVTAGIVSAKGRNINILGRQSRFPIESFIQTDAAVNPGNSGGALVDLNGNLIGINTAIATPTGTFAGYSFAVPVNIVEKVVGDLLEYGSVQRGYLGVIIGDLTADIAEQLDVEELNGIYVKGANAGSGAEEAGIKEGDVIIMVEGFRVSSVAELQEQISKFRPGQKAQVTVNRRGTLRTFDVVLKTKDNETRIATNDHEMAPEQNLLGATIKPLNNAEVERYKLDGGVKIESLGTGVLKNNTSIKPGFIVTKVDRIKIANAADLKRILRNKRAGDGVMLEGFYPNNANKKLFYAFGL